MNEEEKKKKAFKKRLIIYSALGVCIIVVSVIVAIAFKKNKELRHAHEEDAVYKDVIRDKNVITKLVTFVNSAMYNEFGYEGLTRTFVKGTNKLSDKQKLQLVFQYLTDVVIVNEKIDKDNIPERYKTDENISNPNIVMSMLSSRTLEKEYKNFFNEEPKYDEEKLKSLKTCPLVYKLDTRIKKIFLFHDCKLEGDSLVISKIYNYKFDSDYYYVYQYVALMKISKDDPNKKTYWTIKSNKKVDVDDFSKNESLFETIVWKFDKNLNFISTTNGS